MRGFISALSFLTMIPFPDRLKSHDQNGMFSGYPAAGLIIGCLLSLLFLAAGKLFPDALAAITLVAGSLLLTGAIHLDGLADCADAFYGRRSREETLRILKDPRIGTMGGAAIGISLLARFAAVSSLAAPVVLLALPLLTAFSRTTVLVALRFLPYVRAEGGIISTGAAGRASRGGTLAVAVLVIVVVAILLPVPTVAALLALAAFWRLSWKRIGGSSGDVLGASIEIAEIVFLAGLAAQDHVGAAAGLFYPLASLILPAVTP
jgi:adenosylcobinamide-GDP ribazoletransferase